MRGKAGQWTQRDVQAKHIVSVPCVHRKAISLAVQSDSRVFSEGVYDYCTGAAVSQPDGMDFIPHNADLAVT